MLAQLLFVLQNTWLGILFASFVVSVYWSSLRILAARALARLRNGSPRPLTRTERLSLTLSALGLPCLAWGYFVEPYRLQVTRVAIASTKLATASRPIRLVLVSDLHSDPRPRLERELPDIVAAQRPDLIAFTGDAVNSPQALPVFKDCLSRIARLAPTFAVSGNWDAWYWPDLDRFGETGAVVLDGGARSVTLAGVQVWIAGVGADHGYLARDAFSAVPPEAFLVFLHHYPYPDVLHPGSRAPDLFLAGHVHGGQVALPGFGALVTLSKYGKRYEAGLYDLGPTHLYVSRGIGMEGGVIPRVRFLAPPELTVFDLVRP